MHDSYSSAQLAGEETPEYPDMEDRNDDSAKDETTLDDDYDCWACQKVDCTCDEEYMDLKDEKDRENE